MSKYSKEFKLKVIQDYLSGREGLKRVSLRYGVAREAIAKWAARYSQHGLASFERRGVHYTAEFKLDVLRHMRAHALSINQVSAHFNIPAPSTVSVWLKRHEQGGEASLSARPRGRPKVKEIMNKPFEPSNKDISELSAQELIRELQYLRAENAYLKKLQALVQSKRLAQPIKRKSSPS
jgi:transposase